MAASHLIGMTTVDLDLAGVAILNGWTASFHQIGLHHISLNENQAAAYWTQEEFCQSHFEISSVDSFEVIQR
jgi:hypothetical protein